MRRPLEAAVNGFDDISGGGVSVDDCIIASTLSIPSHWLLEALKY